MTMNVNYSIIFVSDMTRSVAFYRDVLGLPLRFETPHWTEFATGGATLALHASDEPAATGEPGREAPGSCRPGFSVPDLDAFHQTMLSRGVTCLQTPKNVFGAQIAQYVDPDGLALSVSQERT